MKKIRNDSRSTELTRDLGVLGAFHFGVVGDSRNGAPKRGVTKLELGNEIK